MADEADNYATRKDVLQSTILKPEGQGTLSARTPSSVEKLPAGVTAPARDDNARIDRSHPVRRSLTQVRTAPYRVWRCRMGTPVFWNTRSCR